MLRENNAPSLHWMDKTMSVMRERRMEACESRLSDYPSYDLFEGCDDEHAEELWSLSFYAQEHPLQTCLHDVKTMQEQVLGQLREEANLLSWREHQLVEQMILHHGEVELLDTTDGEPAESLVQRLWCHLRWQGEDQLFLCLPQKLMVLLGNFFATPEHDAVRERLMRCEAVIRAMLYMDGCMDVHEPMQHLLQDVVESETGLYQLLSRRFLRVSFDYTYDKHGEMVLIHPGLAEPERVKDASSLRTSDAMQVDQMTMLGAMTGLLPQEMPLHFQLLGLLHGAVRPEITEEEAAEDLRMLAKQNVGLPEMNEVLASLLMVQPTQEMLACVQAVQRQTPRWCGMTTAVVQ